MPRTFGYAVFFPTSPFFCGCDRSVGTVRAPVDRTRWASPMVLRAAPTTTASPRTGHRPAILATAAAMAARMGAATVAPTSIAATAAMAAMATTPSRDNLPMLQWAGDVDDTIQLIWRNGSVRIQQGNGGAPLRVRSTVSGAVRRDLPGQISVRLRDGRGTVDVIQQPSSANNYTGIIRISDPQSGYGHYNFDATWQ